MVVICMVKQSRLTCIICKNEKFYNIEFSVPIGKTSQCLTI